MKQFLIERVAGPACSPDAQYLSFYDEEAIDRQVKDRVEYILSGLGNGILWLVLCHGYSDG